MQHFKVPYFFLFSVCFSLIFCFSLVSCFSDSGISVKGALTGSSNPPVLLEVQSVSEKSVRLVFDKEVEVFGNSFEPFQATSDGFGIVVTLDAGLQPGAKVELRGRVKDSDGNTTGFTTPVWGWNPALAGMLINELATKTEPKTEILITSDGNIAGAVLYNGVPDNNSGKAILPSLDVKKGDYVVVWWTSEIVKDYGNDVLADTVSKGYSNNGIQTLAVSPAQGASVIDCIVYSNCSSTYQGYGSAQTLSRVTSAVEKGWWADVDSPVLSTNSTKLRTICRNIEHRDTDSSADWYIAAKNGASFGKDNNSEIYLP